MSTAPSGRGSSVRKAARWALATIAFGATILVLLGLGGPASPAPYFGTRLGMSERAVRDRFEGRTYGTWSMSGTRDQPALRWTRARDRPSMPLYVAFEFNEDRLVAIRADLENTEALAMGPPVESSFAAVLARRPEPDGTVRLTVLSRTCSKHVAEAARLIASGHESAILSPIANRP